VQKASVVDEPVDFLRQVAEAVDWPAAQHLAHRGAQEPEMLLGLKQRVAAGDPGQDHIGAVAEGHLAVVEQQHDRNRRPRLDDLLEARAYRLAGVSKSVGPRARLDCRQVAVEKPRPPDDWNDVADLRHDFPPCQSDKAASRPN
jgi:hypothetical protein